MSDEFEPSTWAQPVQDLVKEYNTWDAEQTAPLEVQTEPDPISLSMVRRGVLDPETGEYTGSIGMKQGTILSHNLRGFSEVGKRNYEAIFGHP